MLEGNRQGSDAADEPPPVDKSLFCAELTGVILGILGFLLLVSGAGFYTVHPPGEDELCQVKTLGLQNETKGDQDFKIGACHGLYTGVFNTLGFISIPFLVVGAMATGACFLVVKGAMAKDADASPSYFRKAAFLDFVGGLAVWIPSMIFPAVAATVDAGMAPIHAYFITLTIAHYGSVMVNATTANDPAVIEATHIFDTVWLGYCAASRVELCLTVGSLAMLALFWVFLFDLGRNVAAMTCWKPKYEEVVPGQAMQLWKTRQLLREKYAAWKGPPEGTPME